MRDLGCHLGGGKAIGELVSHYVHHARCRAMKRTMKQAQTQSRHPRPCHVGGVFCYSRRTIRARIIDSYKKPIDFLFFSDMQPVESI